MKYRIETQVTYHLEMNDKEATWLKNTFQNPMFNDSEEPLSTRKMREDFVNALKGGE